MTVFLFVLSAVLIFGGTVLVLRRLIPYLMSRKMSQPIYEIGPRWHKDKKNTPTMGGLSFFISVTAGAAVSGAVSFLIVGEDARTWFLKLLPFLLTLLYALSSGAIGIIDDRKKLLHRQNDAGLTAGQKYLLQLVTAIIYIALLSIFGAVNTDLYIPFFRITWHMGIFYYPVAVLLLTGIVNAVNLTDGIDGLSSSVTAVVAAFLGCAAIYTSNAAAGFAGGCIFGAALGFLVYNLHPARVFMGDTGSLFFGAFIVGGMFLLGNPLIVVTAGIIYIAETASVMLQVVFFKLSRKFSRDHEPRRIFAMTPLHHHFEHLASPEAHALLHGHEWSENRIVMTFTAVTAAACVLSFLFEYVLAL